MPSILTVRCGTIGLWLTALLGTGLTGQAAAALRLSTPLDYQVVQRRADEGFIPVSGAITDVDRLPDVVEARWVATSGQGEWRTLRLRGGAWFEGALLAPAGGWYRIEVQARSANVVTTATRVEHVGVGEVFVVAGQSNSANHGEERQETRTGLVSALADGHWQLARDPQPGASGGGGSFIPPLGDALVDRFKVPVGFVATGVGATSVREWLPRGIHFPNPPTLTGNVTHLPGGDWESTGELFRRFVARLQQVGPRGYRAVLWHQGESDANQSDTTRTLTGGLYRQYLTEVIRSSGRASGWEAPWFVAQVSYHTPADTGSADIRSAQQGLGSDGTALAGPDSDALAGDLRDGDGKGVHFSGKGLREHAARWAEKVGPWVEQQLSVGKKPASTPASAPSSRLALPGSQALTAGGRPGFLYMPREALRTRPQPWIFYAPTLAPLPDEAERWMHEQFLAAGIAVAGVDVGEAYGSPASHAIFDALYRDLVVQRGFAPRPCLMGRSRGGLWVASWAIQHPERIAGIIGIYPVYDFRTYPGLSNVAPAYGLTPEALGPLVASLNPIERMDVLARARVPVALIHGDVDKVVPLPENSGRVKQIYEAAGAGDLVKLTVLQGQGHNFFEGFFHSQSLVDFGIARARAGVK